MKTPRFLICLVLGGALSAQETTELLPLAKGNRWTYSASAGGEIVSTVDRFEKLEGVECAVVSTKLPGAPPSDEWIATGGGTIRSLQQKSQAGTVTYGKPIVYLKLPPKNGDRWTCSWYDLQQNHFEGSYSVETPAKVTVAGKQQEAVKVTGIVKGPQGQLQIETWFQSGIGMIKQVYTQEGQQMSVELTDAKLAAVGASESAPGDQATLPCDKCSKPVAKGAKFCAECGAPAPKPKPKPVALDVCAKCNTKLVPGAKFCAECGAPAPKPQPAASDLCTKCGKKLAAGAKFCTECGAPAPGGEGGERGRGNEPAKEKQGEREKEPLEKYESADGKVVLFRPRGWKVAEGDLFGAGTYGVTVESPGETAGVMMIAIPQGGDKQLASSVDFANLVLANLGAKFADFKVDTMTSSEDRARTCAEVRFADEGKAMAGHFYFFWTPRVATFLGLGSVATEFDAMRPTLTRVAANLAYSPEGATKVLAEARERAERGAEVVARVATPGGGVQLGTPVQMIQQAKQRQPPAASLQKALASDGSATIGLPPGWQVESAGGQYVAVSDPKRRSAVFYTTRNLYTPDRTGLGLDQAVVASGGIVAPVMSPAQALAFLAEKLGTGREVRVLSGNALAELDPRIDQQLRQIAMQSGSNVDSQLLLADFTLAATGERCRGIFCVTVLASSMGNVWTVVSAGSYAPAEEYASSLPLFLAVADSYAMDQGWANQKQQQQSYDLAQSQADLRKSITGLSQQYERNNAAWHERQKTYDYLSWARSQTTLGQGTWVAQREGGEVVSTSAWGARDHRGYEAEGQPWNTTNFQGRSPWTGEQLHEVNTRGDYERYVRNR